MFLFTLVFSSKDYNGALFVVYFVYFYCKFSTCGKFLTLMEFTC